MVVEDVVDQVAVDIVLSVEFDEFRVRAEKLARSLVGLCRRVLVDEVVLKGVQVLFAGDFLQLLVYGGSVEVVGDGFDTIEELQKFVRLKAKSVFLAFENEFEH